VDGLTSVVTVNFNAGDLLTRSANAVLASTSPVELFVVDNGSTDGSVERLESGAAPGRNRLAVTRAGANLGFARATNLGLRSAAGDYVLLLNPDCLVAPDTVARMRAVMDARPEAGMAGPLILNPDGTEQAGCRRAVPTPWRSLVRTLGLGRLFPGRRFDDFVLAGQPLPSSPAAVEAISGAFMLVRRQALEAVGALDEGYFLHCEDIDWCMRFRQAGHEVLFVPDVTVVHHKGACSKDRPVRVQWHMHRGMIRFYGKFFRRRYPLPMMWLVYAGVWLRFAAHALRIVARGRAAA
jgi:GT2 family glycosyltransferase